MIRHLYIKNFLFIDTLDLTLDSGVIALTGETGAGKSILLGAIEAALGQRTAPEKIRGDAKEAEIILTFDIRAHSEAHAFLRAQRLEEEEPLCIIRYILCAEGKARYFINGRPSGVGQVRALGGLLLTLHLQHDNQLLLTAAGQTQLLDAYAAVTEQVKEIQKIVLHWRKIQQEISRWNARASADKQHIDYLLYQSQELQAAKIDQEEIATLPLRHKTLLTAQETAQHYAAILSAFAALAEEEVNLIDRVRRLRQPILAAEKISHHAELSELLEQVLSSMAALHDAAQRYADNVTIDLEEQARIEARFTELYQLARKHRVQLEELPQLAENIQQEMQAIQIHEEKIAQLTEEKEVYAKKYYALSQELTQKRETAGAQLEKKVTACLRELGMPSALLTVQLTRHHVLPSTPRTGGEEHAAFLLQANAQQPALELKKAVSGGELARISLALQTVLATYIQIPTLVLDEVDVGVSGKIAAIIGQKLKLLGQTHQVLCITHQPHIAAAGKQHLYVEKKEHSDRIEITVTALDPEQRVQEIARMLGGITITPNIVQHAADMLHN